MRKTTKLMNNIKEHFINGDIFHVHGFSQYCQDVSSSQLDHSLFDDLWASWTWISKLLPRFGMFSVFISLHKLSAPFSPSCSETLIIHRLFLLMDSSRSCKLSSFFFLCSFWLGNYKGPVFIDSFLCLTHSVAAALYWKFSSHSSYSSAPELLFCSLKLFLSFC